MNFDCNLQLVSCTGYAISLTVVELPRCPVLGYTRQGAVGGSGHSNWETDAFRRFYIFLFDFSKVEFDTRRDKRLLARKGRLHFSGGKGSSRKPVQPVSRQPPMFTCWNLQKADSYGVKFASRNGHEL